MNNYKVGPSRCCHGEKPKPARDRAIHYIPLFYQKVKQWDAVAVPCLYVLRLSSFAPSVLRDGYNNRGIYLLDIHLSNGNRIQEKILVLK